MKTAILPYGTLSAISMVWEGVNVRILSAYRPYDSKEASEGALRNASIKANSDFEEAFWAEVCKQSDVPTLIGGDFNMKPDDIDSRLLSTNQARIPLPVGVTTY